MVKLSEAEWEVMKILWQCGTCTLSDIHRSLNGSGIPWVTNTVHTLLGRLVKKGAAEVDRTASPQMYTAAVTHEMCGTEEASSLVKRIYDGSVSKMVSSLIASDKLSDDDINELRKLLDDLHSSGKH